ncbi:dihydrofolate reductase [Saprolegnia parasitica CBS 223.65]|uniref:dihydrofolate reductase n=1 Tax=Saprolegnia parasitica (strain CBS 223.65) TaxID=695850 RepID=A0A067BG70_SAPPC|nr:dihydrofolate reductase [Saprolegnia parasitica CBS 223.65]KDO17143.1 dihydrofolate reductase [Saprolegnia parasitica CBS 223.65]|eukprot:XP_012212146.1 dihydrofolate reductase [Saprolegnia parasitica CBS 223.65]
MQINIIAAVPRNRVIGRNGTLPWSLPKDWNYFLDTVKGHVSIMGKTCFDEFAAGPAFPAIVVSRTLIEAGKTPPHTNLASSYEEALDIARNQGVNEVWILGGQRIYTEALATADKLYITRIDAEYDGDTLFPEWDKHFSVCESRVEDEDNGVQLAFEVWSKAQK